MEDIANILCRVVQANPTETPDRWKLIAESLQQAIETRGTAVQSLKARVASEGPRVPGCWEAEQVTGREHLAKRRLDQTAEQEKKSLGQSLFGKKDDAGETDRREEGGHLGSNSKGGVSREASASSDVAGDAEAVPTAHTQGGGNPSMVQGNTQHSLTKYEVFALMRWVHGRIDPMAGNESAAQDMRRAVAVVDRLYEDLPAAKVKAISQENRLKARLGSDSLAYGEINVDSFLKVGRVSRLLEHTVMWPFPSLYTCRLT